MSEDETVYDGIRIEIDASQELGEVVVEGLQGMGLALVPKSLARAAYRVADLFEARMTAAGADRLLDDSLEQAMDGLISQVAIARARKPGEQAT